MNFPPERKLPDVRWREEKERQRRAPPAPNADSYEVEAVSVPGEADEGLVPDASQA
jgi:hypothetical protein